MRLLMITWTDIFESIGGCFESIFKGMRMLGQIPNILMGGFVVSLLALWCYKIYNQKKESERNGTLF